MINVKPAIILALSIPFIQFAHPEVFDGLILYGPMNSRNTYLIDTSGQRVNTWSSNYTCAYMCYLLPDSTIWRGDVYSGASMRGAAYGGLIQRYTWDGNIIKSFVWSNTNHQQHHDICPMPNGHILLISWERKTAAEARAMGRQNIYSDMWPDEVIEYDPENDSVVWEWHFWDHLIQDVDSTKPNYGVVSEHPELLDINLGSVIGGDWMHCNTIDYNAERDEIILTSHNLHEIYVIDHSTTTEEARGHTGGRHGKGGDIIYRWGNPQNYDRGTSADRVFYVVHGANWIRPEMPGAGDIIVLNNGDRPGTANDYSEIIQITPPLDSNDHYYIHPDSAFGPRTPTWSYSNPGSFYSQHLGGAYRLPNGNTFAILGTTGRFVEVDSAGEVVWTYNIGYQIGRAMKYPRAYLTGVQEQFVVHHSEFIISPNPFDRSTKLNYQLARPGFVQLAIYDAIGRMVALLINRQEDAGRHQVIFKPDSRLKPGIYFALLSVLTNAGKEVGSQRLIRAR
ncbi:MAG: aryl-sulfate sulfotransferase [candidate division WOR-3 bacterium]